MLAKRIIACLDVRDEQVVKGVQFEQLREAGDPAALACRYNVEGIDELVILDITATHERRETIVELARRTADNVFVPFTIGGGIRSVADAQAVLDAGADKVSVNSAAVAWLAQEGFTAGATRVPFEERVTATYRYEAADGSHAFDVVRLRDPKDFRQRAPNGDWKVKGIAPVLYRLPQLLAAPGGDLLGQLRLGMVGEELPRGRGAPLLPHEDDRGERAEQGDEGGQAQLLG